MFPTVPLLALAGILGGVVTLAWYAQLGSEEKERTDRLTREIFGKHLTQLTRAEAKTIAARVQAHNDN